MKRMISFFTRLCEAYMPDAFVFCLGLTLLVFVLCAGLTPHSPSELINFWGKEFWSINAFAMQMVFVLISGHMLATTPVVNKLLLKLSSIVKNETQGLILLSLFSTIACFINWGFGLIVSGILAIELAKKLGKVNFGLFIATAYAGFLVWHGGLSGSIPLKIQRTTTSFIKSIRIFPFLFRKLFSQAGIFSSRFCYSSRFRLSRS